MSKTEKVEIRSPVMERNDSIAAENRSAFDEGRLLAINVISSPGAGKTTLLEQLASRLQDSLVVIEGDVQTQRDAERVRRAGSEAVQIETGGACHLDAEAIRKAHASLRERWSESWRYLVIENVGNLICPSSFYLGEHLLAGILSLPEGDDKVMKYPALFSRIDILLINKIDLLDHMDFDLDRAISECRSLNPDVSVFPVSARSGEGVAELLAMIAERRKSLFES